jgi:hypothetical protein
MNKKEWEYRKSELPYGTWTLADGALVLFNRYYAPMHKRAPDGSITSWPKPYTNDHNPSGPTWVKWTSQSWLYDDATPEPQKRKAGIKALEAWGLSPP